MYLSALFVFLIPTFTVGHTATEILNLFPKECQNDCSEFVDIVFNCIPSDQVQWKETDNKVSIQYTGKMPQVYRCLCSAKEGSSPCLTCLTSSYCLTRPLYEDLGQACISIWNAVSLLPNYQNLQNCAAEKNLTVISLHNSS